MSHDVPDSRRRVAFAPFAIGGTVGIALAVLVLLVLGVANPVPIFVALLIGWLLGYAIVRFVIQR